MPSWIGEERAEAATRAAAEAGAEAEACLGETVAAGWAEAEAGSAFGTVASTADAALGYVPGRTLRSRRVWYFTWPLSHLGQSPPSPRPNNTPSSPHSPASPPTCQQTAHQTSCPASRPPRPGGVQK